MKRVWIPQAGVDFPIFTVLASILSSSTFLSTRKFDLPCQRVLYHTTLYPLRYRRHHNPKTLTSNFGESLIPFETATYFSYTGQQSIDLRSGSLVSYSTTNEESSLNTKKPPRREDNKFLPTSKHNQLPNTFTHNHDLSIHDQTVRPHSLIISG